MNKGRNEVKNGGLLMQNSTENSKKQVDITSESWKCKMEDISAKIEYLIRDNEQMKDKIKYYEDRQRKKNLIFFGVNEKGHEYEMDIYETPSTGTVNGRIFVRPYTAEYRTTGRRADRSSTGADASAVNYQLYVLVLHTYT
ncbi:hypothetical protein ANN_01350 [Periplaneta americana]|uniref:Uncharacterized protein n=1 Tax=Periplaneta americana TaxID=6978 RepID=A0ABQ8TVS1_PERAM|nr:hypothetical protein ANN_01350 [Periplaneta americana]